jgi:prepilin-type N-terminal cleavage/methylation domain-containing protein
MSFQSTNEARRSEGFTLVETIVALFLIGLAVLAAAPMFMYATQVNAVGADFGTGGAKAVERMEELRGSPFATLVAGGSLTGDTAGYFDASDPSYTIRWQITDNGAPPDTKTIEVRCVAMRTANANMGNQKQVTLTSLRGP